MMLHVGIVLQVTESRSTGLLVSSAEAQWVHRADCEARIAADPSRLHVNADAMWCGTENQSQTEHPSVSYKSPLGFLSTPASIQQSSIRCQSDARA
jgi:hypothetical protein